MEFLGLGLADRGRLEQAELNPEEHDEEWGGCWDTPGGREEVGEGAAAPAEGRECAPPADVEGREEVGEEDGGEGGRGSARQLTVSCKLDLVLEYLSYTLIRALVKECF